MHKGSNVSRGMRITALIAMGALVGTMLVVTPVGAHVGGSVGHLVGHLKASFYTKSKANDRFLEPTVQPGETIRGTVGEQVRVSNVGEIGLNAQLPRSAPVGLDDDHVVIDGVDDPTGACQGTSTSPTATPGFVCIYEYANSGVTPGQGAIWSDGDGTKWGFQVSLEADSTNNAYWFANWAYRAPVSSSPASAPAEGSGCADAGLAGC